MKHTFAIVSIIGLLFLSGCNGSKKYFKAAEKLEKQGLTSDAAEYYLESLQRKPTNVDARIKLKNVGQKYVSSLASDFFRNFNTQQLETSLETYEKLKAFTNKTSSLNVIMDYPKSYDEDYQKAVENYCSKNYNIVCSLVNQKKYADAISYINNIKKYNPNYKTIQQLEIVANCEPLYQSAIISLENKNYAAALVTLSRIKTKTENYKDYKELFDFATANQTKEIILIQPKSTTNASEKEIEDYLFNMFTQTVTQKFPSIKLVNNTPFEGGGNNSPDLSSANNLNLDLIQAIRKATDADYFYIYDVANKNEITSGPTKSPFTAYLEVKTKKNDTLIITEYKPVSYNLVKASRNYAYEFKYKIIDAFSNQILSSQTQNVSTQDNIEYNEFTKNFTGNINKLFPYNPQQTSPMAQYNPKNWRVMFNANSALKSFDVLKSESNTKCVNFFTTSLTNNIK